MAQKKRLEIEYGAGAAEDSVAAEGSRKGCQAEKSGEKCQHALIFPLQNYNLLKSYLLLGRNDFENGSKSASERRKGAKREKEKERESESRMDEENALKGKEAQLDGMKA